MTLFIRKKYSNVTRQTIFQKSQTIFRFPSAGDVEKGESLRTCRFLDLSSDWSKVGIKKKNEPVLGWGRARGGGIVFTTLSGMWGKKPVFGSCFEAETSLSPCCRISTCGFGGAIMVGLALMVWRWKAALWNSSDAIVTNRSRVD